jgi:hypothetical protein
VADVMGLSDLDPVTFQQRYLELIQSKGGFTLGVFREMVRDLSLQFKQQEGRYYVLLSLIEAENLRAIMHGRAGRSLLLSEETAFVNGAVCTTGAMWVMGDYDVSLLDTTAGFTKSRNAQHQSMVNSLRFMNSDSYYNTSALTVLLRVLEQDSCESRMKWWHEVRACRRRRQVALDGSSPIMTIFNTRSEFEFMEFKAIVSRVQTGLQEKGMLIFDAFRAFNSSHSGLLTCSELYGGMDFLGISFTPQQIYDLVKKIAVQTEVIIIDMSIRMYSI